MFSRLCKIPKSSLQLFRKNQADMSRKDAESPRFPSETFSSPPIIWKVGLVSNRRAHDAADNRTAEDGEPVAAVVDVNDRRRRWRRRGRNPATVVMMRGGAMMNGCGLRAASAMRGCHSRAAEGHTRECRDCHCLDRLVHVTPTFPGFLPLHKARRGLGCFLTR